MCTDYKAITRNHIHTHQCLFHQKLNYQITNLKVSHDKNFMVLRDILSKQKETNIGQCITSD